MENESPVEKMQSRCLDNEIRKTANKMNMQWLVIMMFIFVSCIAAGLVVAYIMLKNLSKL